MKTAEEWLKEGSPNGVFGCDLGDEGAIELIKRIQSDAASKPSLFDLIHRLGELDRENALLRGSVEAAGRQIDSQNKLIEKLGAKEAS